MNTDELTAGDVLAALDTGLLTGLALAVEHGALWRYSRHLDGPRRPVAYVIGTATILAGFWRWALWRNRPGPALALTLVVGLAGTADLACYAYRALSDRQDRADLGTVEGRFALVKGWLSHERTTADTP